MLKFPIKSLKAFVFTCIALTLVAAPCAPVTANRVLAPASPVGFVQADENIDPDTLDPALDFELDRDANLAAGV